MMDQTMSPRHQLQWEQIIRLLTCSTHQSQSNSGSNGNNNKLRIKILDTVFFSQVETSSLSSNSNPRSNQDGNDSQHITEGCNISQWCFTSKKGELTRRKDPNSLTLQHVYDRFCRFALANTFNASGPRIVSFGYLKKPKLSFLSSKHHVGLLKERVSFTEDQLQREISRKNGNLIDGRIGFLQCYLRPYQGRDEFYRGVYKLVVDENARAQKFVQGEVLVQIVQDPVSNDVDMSNPAHDMSSTVQLLDDNKISSLQQWIKQEVEVSVLKIVHHLETNISSLPLSDLKSIVESNRDGDFQAINLKVLRMTVDFVLDDNKQLWLGFIDDVSISGEDNLVEQINALAKEAVENNLATSKKDSDTNIILPQIESCDPRTISAKGKDDKNSPKKLESISTTENDVEMPNDPVLDHHDDLQIKIARLKSKQQTVELAEAETLVKIGQLRKEAHSKLHLQPLEYEKMKSSKQSKESPKKHCNIGMHKQKLNKVKIKEEDASADLKLIQNDLERVQQDNEYLLQSMNNSKGHNEVIDSLIQERDQLHRSLRNEIIKHNDLRNTFEVTSRDLVELKARTKNEIDSLKSNLNSEKDSNKKLVSQMRSTTQVLEAELKVQRDYVNDLRAESWSELATKLKKEVEASVSQELTKSTLSVSQAVGSTEARWKIRIQELQVEHDNEVEKMKEEFDSDLRYQLSQNELKFDTARISIEERLKKEYKQSLDVALRQEEILHRNELKNESKRWEQVMMDMKIHLLTEQQQKHRKNLLDRDEHWKGKIIRLQNEAHKAAEEELQAMKTDYEVRLDAKESELVRTMKEAQSKETALIATVEEEISKERQNVSREKDAEMQDKLRYEREEAESRFRDEIEKVIENRAKGENKTLSILKAKVNLLKQHNNMTKNSIQKDLQTFRQSQINDMKCSIAKILGQSNQLVRRREVEIAKQYEEKLFEATWRHKEAMKAIQSKADDTIEEQLRIAKENEAKVVEESLQSLAQEYEEQIQSLEYDISWAKSQKITAEDQAKEFQSKMVASQNLLERTKTEMDTMRVNNNFEKLFFIAKAMSLKETISDKEKEHTHLMGCMEQRHKEAEQDLRKKIQSLEKQCLKYEQRLKLVSNTLLNHRRDELLQHKTKSKEVAQEMKALNDNIDAVESERGNLLDLLSHLENEMKDVERRIYEHSQVSALQGGGKINVHHARKKRRLDEEYEQIITKIESKRDDLITFDDEVKTLNMKKVEMNDKMRGLERSLVELLVDQQKKLLSISSNEDKANK